MTSQVSSPGKNGLCPTQDNEPLSIDEIIDRALQVCRDLPPAYSAHVAAIEELRNRLAKGRLHLAVLGQFNRGKSTFINALIGIKILPTSVLPLTSVPTLICWGTHLKCIVRFLNGKPDLVVQKSLEDITATLTTYVAEEHNPRNQLCVREVEVQCPSVLLENGTVLIDTPGFGSTYLHNTRTALESLGECDAALFLVSADPPLTQMEVEFLKQVQNQVARVFFILNKIDLLNESELAEVDRFIRETLISRMGYEVDLRLFHICALMGLSANKQHLDDMNWKNSGMDAIHSGVLDFMTREKYFTLSQALTEKLREALSEITSALAREIDEYCQPMSVMSKEHQDFLTGAESIRKLVEKEIALVEVEKKAVLKFLDEQAQQGQEAVESALLLSLNSLFTNSSGVLKTIDNLTTALNKIIIQTLSMLRTTAISHVNRPYRKAIQLHLREFAKIRQMIIECVGGSPESLISAVQEKLEATEIEADENWSFPASVSSKDIASEWTDWFQNRQTRIARVRNRLETLTRDMIFQNKRECFIDLSIRYKNAFERIRTTLCETYSELTKSLDTAILKKEQSLTQRKVTSESPITKLHNHIAAINSIISLLK
ncbi:MAG TPA: dynamin family protein [Chitinispirillaceae bacterium]|nr:dynamin family protein [Chitinispirillaceae bacterium]